MTNLHPSYKYTFNVEAKFDYGLWSDIVDGSTAFIAMLEDGKRYYNFYSSGQILMIFILNYKYMFSVEAKFDYRL